MPGSTSLFDLFFGSFLKSHIRAIGCYIKALKMARRNLALTVVLPRIISVKEVLEFVRWAFRVMAFVGMEMLI